MHEAEQVNVIGTELLNRFSRVQAPDLKGHGEGRKSGGTSLRPVIPNEPGVERRTKWKP